MQTILQKIQKAIETMLNPKSEVVALDSVKLARLQGLAEMLAKTQADEQGCEDVYEVIDQYADLTLAGEDAGILMPLVEHHLSICNGCCEEYEMLLGILKLDTITE